MEASNSRSAASAERRAAMIPPGNGCVVLPPDSRPSAEKRLELHRVHRLQHVDVESGGERLRAVRLLAIPGDRDEANVARPRRAFVANACRHLVAVEPGKA